MDEERILKKIDELDLYMNEIKDFIPKNFEDYMNSRRTRRVCERLLQISIECVIDICGLLVKELKLGTPSDEEDLFQKLNKKKIISNKMVKTLKRMKGFRNVLVHRYAEVDDELVFRYLKNNMEDFRNFKKDVLDFLRAK